MHRVRMTCIKLTILLNLFTMMLHANPDNYDFAPNREQIDDCCSKACCPSPCQFFVRGDILYWTPRVTGLELTFGTTEIVENVVGCTQILTTEEADLDPHFNWDAGYRVGGGYETDDWKAEALWTHFHGNGKRNNHEGLNITNQGKLKIELDQVDLALSYDYDLGCSLTLQPFFGVRGTRIHQHIDAHLVTEITLFPDSLALETRTFDDRQKYWGVGPLLGVQADWEIGCGFGLYGAVAASVLYGDYEVHFDDADIYSTPISKQIFNVNKRHVHAFDYNLDLALGLSWHICLCNQYELGMKLGFEQHQYFNQNRLCVGRGDISFTGGVFSLELGF